jgi:hypothetical protein
MPICVKTFKHTLGSSERKKIGFLRWFFANFGLEGLFFRPILVCDLWRAWIDSLTFCSSLLALPQKSSGIDSGYRPSTSEITSPHWRNWSLNYSVLFGFGQNEFCFFPFWPLFFASYSVSDPFRFCLFPDWWKRQIMPVNLVRGGGERVGGYPFFGQGERRNGVKWYKIVSFYPFLYLYGIKTLKSRSNYPLGPIYGCFYLLLAFLAICSLFWTFW